jgi:hypothetical protein
MTCDKLALVGWHHWARANQSLSGMITRGFEDGKRRSRHDTRTRFLRK